MKTKFLLILCLYFSFAQLAHAGLFHADSVYLFSEPYNLDSSSVYVVVKGYFGTNCSFQCSKAYQFEDSAILKAGFSVGPATIICPLTDTFFVGRFPWGTVKFRTIIGANTIINCDSFYTINSYDRSIDLLPNSIRIIKTDALLWFPNPVANRVTIISEDLMIGSKLSISNATGAVVMQSVLMNPKKNEVDVSELPAGIYFFSVTSERGRVVRRFVKE